MGESGAQAQDPEHPEPPEGSHRPERAAPGREQRRAYELPERPKFPGSDVLFGRSPKEVLARLCDGDPLDLSGRTSRRFRQRAYLLALQRLYLRAVARVAHAAPSYRGEPPLGEWIDSILDTSMAELVREDAFAEQQGIPPATPWDPDYAFITEISDAEPAQARAICVSFNSLPDEVRRTWFALAVDKKSLHRWVAEGHGPPARAVEMYERATLTLTRGRDPRAPGLGDEGPEETP